MVQGRRTAGTYPWPHGGMQTASPQVSLRTRDGGIEGTRKAPKRMGICLPRNMCAPGMQRGDCRGLPSAVTSIAEELSLKSVRWRKVRSACELLDAQQGALGVVTEGWGLSQFLREHRPRTGDAHRSLQSGTWWCYCAGWVAIPMSVAVMSFRLHRIHATDSSVSTRPVGESVVSALCSRV